MKKSLFVLFFLFTATALMAQGDGEIVNINVLQRDDGTGTVDIFYDISDVGSNYYNISLEVSFNGGNTFEQIDPAHFVGDIRNVQEGTGYHIIWYGMVSHPGIETEQAQIKIIADYVGGSLAFNGINYTVQPIGNKVWFAQNLQSRFYDDGEPIEQWTPDFIPFEDDDRLFFIYPYEFANNYVSSGMFAQYTVEPFTSNMDVADAYGYHYNFATVRSGNICPAGWRVATLQDWRDLRDYAINNFAHVNEDNVAHSFRSCREAISSEEGCSVSSHPLWLYDSSGGNPAGTDDMGLSIVPAGLTYASTAEDMSAQIGVSAVYWAPVLSGQGPEMRFVQIVANSGEIEEVDPGMSFDDITVGLSVRCVKDLD